MPEPCQLPAVAAARAGEIPTPEAALAAVPVTDPVAVPALDPAAVPKSDRALSAACGPAPAAPVWGRARAQAEAVMETRPHAAAERQKGRRHRSEKEGSPVPPPGAPRAPPTSPRTRFHVKRRRR